jgi:hypothetical protein
MSVKRSELKIWSDMTDHQARRECAIYHWSGCAEALHRAGLLDEEELREMIEYSDAAYGYGAEEQSVARWA